MADYMVSTDDGQELILAWLVKEFGLKDSTAVIEKLVRERLYDYELPYMHYFGQIMYDRVNLAKDAGVKDQLDKAIADIDAYADSLKPKPIPMPPDFDPSKVVLSS